jgi:uncharacterized protein (UPF0332 family)
MTSPFEEKMEKISATPADAHDKITKAYRRFNSAKKLFSISEQEDYDSIYTQLYDAIRISLDSFLTLRGWRIKTTANHHKIILDQACCLLREEKIDIKNEIDNAKKMSKRRNRLDYGGKDEISKNDIEAAFSDAQKILKTIEIIIEKKVKQQKLIN